MFPKILFVLSAFSVITSALSAHIERAADIIPLQFIGGVGAVQTTTGDTRLYYQNSDGSIREIAVSNVFASGHVVGGDNLLVPAGQAKYGTPIAAVTFGGDVYQAIHVYFFSPNNILSEYIYTSTAGWMGGPTCSNCVTNVNYAVQPGSNVLYAMQNPSTGTHRVGFVSANFPGTLSEADRANGSWQLAPLN